MKLLHRGPVAFTPVVSIIAFLLALGEPALAQTVGKAPAGKSAQPPYETLDKSKFSRSTTIDNEWLPLTPGARRVYEGFSAEGNRRIPRRLVLTVTDVAKVIDGVRTLAVWGVDYAAGRLGQSDISFYAQADDGTVWYLGEYSEEYEGGKLASAPAWLHGRDQARAGIMMPADPRPGTPSYSQAWAPAAQVTDRGKVDQIGARTCVPTGCYEGVLVIAETSKEEPRAEQLKYYARGVGNVRIGWRGKGDKGQETLELKEIVALGPEDLAKARAAALDLDRRAHRSSKVFEGIPPAEPIRP
jgi:hypothetical protein